MRPFPYNKRNVLVVTMNGTRYEMNEWMKSSLIKIEYAVPATTIYWFIHIYIYMLFSLYMRVPNFYNARTRALDILVNHVYYIIFIYLRSVIHANQQWFHHGCRGREVVVNRHHDVSILPHDIYITWEYPNIETSNMKNTVLSHCTLIKLFRKFATLSMIAFSFSR